MSSSSDTSEKHPKQDFQVERIAFFSDAVFAIAITLLVIEFRAPHVSKETTIPELWHQISHLKFQLISVLVSFILIITYWMRHHKLFKHIHNYNRAIIISNMACLLPIIFFPFTTSFLYETISENRTAFVIPFQLFIFNNIIAGAATYYFYFVVMKKYKEMSYPMTKNDASAFEFKLLIMTLSFALVLVISIFSFDLSGFGFLPIVVSNLTRKFFRSKTAPIK
ncbi:MAG: TMEM175 family protein [Chitinophagaceae bacterium]